MADLIIVAFHDQATAFDAADALVALQAQRPGKMEDVVVISRGNDGRVQMHPSVNLRTGAAIGGGQWGTLIGMLFLNPLADAGLGIGGGALTDRFSDMGMDDKFLDDVVKSLGKSGAAVGMLARSLSADQILETLKPFRPKRRVLRTTLGRDIEARLTEFLDQEVPTLHFPQDQLDDARR